MLPRGEPSPQAVLAKCSPKIIPVRVIVDLLGNMNARMTDDFRNHLRRHPRLRSVVATVCRLFQVRNSQAVGIEAKLALRLITILASRSRRQRSSTNAPLRGAPLPTTLYTEVIQSEVPLVQVASENTLEQVAVSRLRDRLILNLSTARRFRLNENLHITIRPAALESAAPVP